MAKYLLYLLASLAAFSFIVPATEAAVPRPGSVGGKPPAVTPVLKRQTLAVPAAVMAPFKKSIDPRNTKVKNARASMKVRLPRAATKPEHSARIKATRQAYVKAVEALKVKGEQLKASGASAESIARQLHADRRALGETYKAQTPPELLEKIYKRNEQTYNGDKLGPSIEFLRAKGKTWEQIAAKAAQPGGKDLGF